MWLDLTTLGLSILGGYLMFISVLDRRSDAWKKYGLQDISTSDPFKKGKVGWTIVGGSSLIAVISCFIPKLFPIGLAPFIIYGFMIAFLGFFMIIVTAITNQAACMSSDNIDCE
tara:strand:+ start:38 stop:379 length:342 start_codon:yes stop_codon:yes gene_type:complete